MGEDEKRSLALLAADLVLFGGADGREVLLVQRGWPPFKGCWALPGGLVEPNETFEEAARRELAEETGVGAPGRLVQVGIYDAPGRDPRGRVVSVAFAARVGDVAARAGDDAAAAGWFALGEVVGQGARVRLAFDHERIVVDACDRRWRSM